MKAVQERCEMMMLEGAEAKARELLERYGHEFYPGERFAEMDDETGELMVHWPVADPCDRDYLAIYADRVDCQGVPRHHTEIVPGHLEMQDFLKYG